ncbi:DUF4760 domain-containing protein [uncultured Cardiobacterium sp.]|uniref:DUF4760 domain-containing protein n=1 Tax=uncultured Cardiobacterium sp. TaxID=417619 RepID=UPI00261BC0B9|nr:DUF4760 domain-containing protein [uncultured Cardiobacterium sp.]
MLSYIKDYQVIISASSAFLGTLYIIKTNKLNTRRKNAADIVCAINDDRFMNEGLQEIRSIMNGENASGRFSELGNLKVREEQRIQQSRIAYVLNRYEYLAVGIFCGTYDEEIIKRSSYNKLIRIFDQCYPMIETVRRVTGKETIWLETQELVARWKRYPLQADSKKRHPRWWRMILPW